MRVLLFLAALAASTGCALLERTPPPGPAAPGAAAPARARGALPLAAGEGAQAAARELPVLPRQPLPAPEGRFHGAVEAAAPPSAHPAQRSTRLAIPLGTQAELRCDVLSEPLDAGGTLWRLVQEAARRAELQQARLLEVLPLGDGAALYLEVRYRVQSAQGPAQGWLKVMLHASPTLPLVCTHDEVGYARSFRRITSGLAESLRPAGPAASAPAPSELHLLLLEGRAVGFEQRTARRTVDGALELERVRSLVRQGSARSLSTQDEVSFEVVAEGGRLVSRRYARAVDGVVELQVSLEHVQGPEYRYEGVQGRRPLSGKLLARGGLLSEQGALQAVREQLLSGRRRELHLEVYAPEVDPGAAVRQVWRRPAAAGDSLTLSMAGREAQLTLDSQGLVERTERTEEGLRLEQLRTRVRGAP